MNTIFTYRHSSLLSLLLVICHGAVFAQQPIVLSNPPDTVRIIQIIQGKSLREKKINDTTTIETIAGNVILKEAQTIFMCDSAVINRGTNILEAYGNVHINQNDSIHTYAKYLRYIGKDRLAYLSGDVKLTDKKGTLYTQELEYDLKTSVGKYFNGGRVVNGQTVLTSNEGVYYAETKDVYFKNAVHLVDPKYDIKTDSLVYNTEMQLVTFITGTRIKSKNGGDIYTSQGTYDLKNGKAYFGKRSIIKDSTRTYVADNMAYDEKTGIAQLEGNAIVKDSVNGYSIIAGQIFANKKDNSFLASRKPVLIFKGEADDSTFVSADTLFSGLTNRDTASHTPVISIDTVKNTMVFNISEDSMARNAPKKDSLEAMNINLPDTLKKNSIAGVATGSSLPAADKKDSLQKGPLLPANTLKKKMAAKPAMDTIRYFLAFHHVRIFNDSLQSVCDSLFYSSEDSVFRLYQQPVVFSHNSQIAGDTIYMYTKNQKAERLHVFENSIIINKTNDNMYNQMGGRTLNGYFKGGELDYVRVKGSPAESIFYPQDDDSAYIGMNRSKGDIIDVYFVKKAVNKVKFINDVDGTLYPLYQVPADQKQLKGFNWQESRRPKNKFELFE